MQSRTSHSHVTFRRPFRLVGMDTWAPAGRYKITMEEERLDTMTVESWRQTALTLQITSTGAIDYLNVDTLDLREALLRDDDDSTDSPGPKIRLRKVLGLRRS